MNDEIINIAIQHVQKVQEIVADGACSDVCPYQIDQLEDMLLALRDYHAAEKDGAILRFPCKIGDTVYLPNRDDDDAIIRHRIVKIGVNAEFGMFFVIDDEDRDEHPIDLFGKEVFLSEEEAAAHYDKFLDGARKAMQFFGIKVGNKLYIPEGTMVGDGSMEYVTVTAVGSDEQGLFFKTNDREHPEKQRDKIGGYYCYTEDEAIKLLESL